MPDETLRCQDCGEDFEFPEGEQKFYETKGFTPPKRCKPCRDKKKAQREGGGGGGGGSRSRDRR